MQILKIILFLFVPLFTESQTARKYSNEFMNIGVDAAALGMSNAVVASSQDVNSAYWNPAGLVHIDDRQIALMHSSYFADIANYNYVAFAMPLDEQTAIGISLIRFGVDDILDTTNLIDQQGVVNYDRINLFSTADYGFTFSFATNELFFSNFISRLLTRLLFRAFSIVMEKAEAGTNKLLKVNNRI